jgi:hypothetical protein
MVCLAKTHALGYLLGPKGLLPMQVPVPVTNQKGLVYLYFWYGMKVPKKLYTHTYLVMIEQQTDEEGRLCSKKNGIALLFNVLF